MARASEVSFWTGIFEYKWSRSFYVVPFAVPILTLLVLWGFSRQQVDTRTVLRVWTIAAPVGFFLWIVAWKSLGAGGGQISPAVGATAFFGWAVWHRGLTCALLYGKPRRGFFLCTASLGAMLLISTAIQSGVAPIRLATMAIFGSPATLLIAALLSVIGRIAGAVHRHFLSRVWRILTTPITIRRIPIRRIPLSSPPAVDRPTV